MWYRVLPIAGVVCLSLASLRGQTWERLNPTGAPSGRQSMAAVYDPVSNQLVIAGGIASATTCLADGFRLRFANGVAVGGSPAWNPILSGNPGTGGCPVYAAAYAPSPDQMLFSNGALFQMRGAMLGTPSIATPRMTPALATRNAPSLVYAPARGSLILFGGVGGAGAPFYYPEVWISRNADQDTGTWTQIPATGPAGRSDHSAVYDPNTDRMIVFGGRASSVFDDVWVLRNATATGGQTWQQLDIAGTLPRGRWGHSAVYDPASNRMIVFGGQTQRSPAQGSSTQEVWILTNANGAGSAAPAWINGTPASGPPQRSGHAAGYDPASNRMVIFGGRDASDFNDTWVLKNANGLQNSLSANPATMTFNATAGSADPAAQNIATSSTYTGLGLTPNATQNNGPPGWLGIGIVSLFTPANVNVSVNTAGLAPGVYTGQVTIRPEFGAIVTVPVTLNLAPCAVTLDPGATLTPAGAGIVSTQIGAASTCAWTATSDSPWLRPQVAGGTGPATLRATIDANPGIASRQGRITINGRIFAVTQAGASCTYSLNPGVVDVAGAGGSGVLTVAPSPAACTWSFASNAPWIRASAGQVANTVAYIVDPNPGLSARQGTITVAGQTFTIRQSPGNCSLSLNPSSTEIAAGAAGGSFAVTASLAACSWSATSSVDWLQVTSGASGTGNGSVGFGAQSNPNAAARSGTISVGGATFTVRQAGGCSLRFTPPGATFDAGGGSGEFSVDAGCAWTALSRSPFLTITSGASGNGAGVVRYTVAANGDPRPRAGTIVVNNVEFPVSQNPSGPACTYSISPTLAIFPPAGGRGTVTVATAAGCGWNASENSDFVTITSGANGSVSGVLTYTVAPNGGGSRSTQISIAGRSLSLTQEGGCVVSLDPKGASFTSAGSRSATVRINTACAWSAQSNSPAAQIVGPSSGSGPAVLTYALDPATAPRALTLTIGGTTFPIAQAGPVCEVSLSELSAVLPASGGTVEIAVTAPAGCPWAAQLPPDAFVTILSGGTGSGNGVVRLSAAANPGAERGFSLRLAGQDVGIAQPAQQAFSCAFPAVPVVRAVRSEGQTELTSDIVLSCTGNAARALNGDVLVTFDTNFTSRLIPGATEALLLLNEPGTPVAGVSAFAGVAAGNNAVRFANVPLAVAGSNNRTLRFTNLRVDASAADAGAEIRAAIEIRVEAASVGVAPSQQVVARRTQGVSATLGASVLRDGQPSLPAQFQEVLPNAFRLRVAANQNPSQPGAVFGNSESGYLQTAVLGDRVGAAETGTRLLVKLRGIPDGVRVTAPVNPSGSTAAVLVAQDAEGAGIGALSGQSQEVQVVNGEATIAWEIVTTEPGSAETLTFFVQFPGATLQQVEQIRAASRALLGPTAGATQTARVQPTPRFRDPGSGPRVRSNLRSGGSFGGAASFARSTVRRDPTGGRSFSLQTTLTCDSDAACPDAVIRGNLSAGASVDACTSADGSSSCQGQGRDVTIEYPRLDPGQSVTAVLAASLRDDAPGGSRVDVTVTGSSDLTTVTTAAQFCFNGFSALPQPLGVGGSGEFLVYACGGWNLSGPPWISFSPAGGNGNTTVRYTVQPNSAATGRSGAVSIPGATPLIVTQPGTQTGGSTVGLAFVPVAPCRVADTRTGEGKSGPFGPPVMAASATRDFPIPQSGCGVPATALAYSLNITVVPDTGRLQFLTAWPSGQPRPLASTLNSFDGKIAANAAIVPAGGNGAVSVFVTDRTHVILDINGYFVP